ADRLRRDHRRAGRGHLLGRLRRYPGRDPGRRPGRPGRAAHPGAAGRGPRAQGLDHGHLPAAPGPRVLIQQTRAGRWSPPSQATAPATSGTTGTPAGAGGRWTTITGSPRSRAAARLAAVALPPLSLVTRT